MTESRPSAIERIKSSVTGRWDELRGRRVWVRHVADAWGLLLRNNGNQYAAAITYFSFLALFPLLLLAVAVVGFLLHAHPAAQQSLFDHITAKVPGQAGQTLKTAIRSAIDARTGVGILGLVGVVLTGLGWIANLRGAIDAVWGRAPTNRSFFAARAANLVVLAGLGLGIVLSLGLTVAGTAVTDQILTAAGLDHLPGVGVLLTVLGLVLGVAGDMLIFWWLLIRLPQVHVPARVALKGALLAAVGFEVLKVLGTYTIARTAHSPTAGPFAGVVAVLIWIQLVARYLLFCCAWLATLADDLPAGERLDQEAPHAAVELVGQPAGTEVRDIGGPNHVADDADTTAAAAPSPLAVAATLVGAGALAGAAATWFATRSRPDAAQGRALQRQP